MANWGYLQKIRAAVEQVDPREVRNSAEREVHVGILAADDEEAAAIAEYLAGPRSSSERRMELSRMVHLPGAAGAPEKLDIEIYGSGPAVAGGFRFDFNNPRRTIEDILEAKQDLGLALARAFAPFREAVTDRIIHSVSRENAYFALATALPGVLPNLPWAIGEAASDTAFLTVNQIRMAFLLAAASDRQIGYREQKAEIASIIAGAFGWRALARELAGKIPLGGGLIPKAAIAYAGTFVAGVSLDRLYRIGYGLSRVERRRVYGEALERGKQIARAFLERRRKQAS